MFIYDNGKVCVFSATRCGHTSMYDYFGIPLHTHTGLLLKDWKNSNSLRVMVLRNPIDRWLSGIRYVQNVEDNNNFYKKDGKFYTIQNHESKDKLLFEHTYPFELLNRHMKKTIPFKIIPFENLQDYIPVSRYTIHVNVEQSHHTDIPMSPDMREAIVNYKYYRQYCEVITPEEWKELTENS